LGSFAAAAEELNVTAGAVSQHIRTLESWTGLPLFERRSQGVRLSTEGRRLLPKFTKAFDVMGTAIRDLRDVSPNRAMSIAALPSVAQLWLQPRLTLFRDAARDATLSVTVSETPPNLERELFDLSLFMRDPKESGIVISQDFLTPVCSPELKVQSLADLKQHRLLHDEVWAQDWPTWVQAAHAPIDRPEDGPRFSLYSMAVEEAKAGAGILIGHTAILDRDLASGALVQPFQMAVPAPYALVAEIADGPFAETIGAVVQSLRAET
jgi:LysR family glycine cleavage system transcriptional activator